MLQMEGLLLTAALLLVVPGIRLISSEDSSFGLTYNGGKLMAEPVTVSLLWFGPGFQESGMKAIRNAISSLSSSHYLSGDADVPTLGDWWEVVRQYKDSTNTPVTDTVDLGDECFYTGPHTDVSSNQVKGVSQSAFNSTLAVGLGNNFTCNNAFQAKENSVYLILFSDNVLFLEEEEVLSEQCSGSLQVEALAGVNVSLEWARAPQAAYDQCSTYLTGNSYIGPPNGDPRTDSMVGFALGKIAERVINPDGRGWASSGDPLTISSYCELQVIHELAPDGPPLYGDLHMNVSFNAVGINGYRYILQYIWDPNINNCALKLSKSCSRTVLFEQPHGHLIGGIGVNHTNGLQPLAPNQKCQWSINYPAAKFISFTVKYLSRARDSDYSVQVCSSPNSRSHCTEVQGKFKGSERRFKLMGSTASIIFTSGDLVSIASRGWELSYSTGLCNGKEDLYHHRGTIGYKPNSGLSYVKGINCQWILHGNLGTPVSINFSHVNVTKDLDFLGIYDMTGHQIANFSGHYSGSDLPKLDLNGTVRIAFQTQTDEGDGWQAEFHIASPVKSNTEVFLAVISATASASVALAFVAFSLSKRRRKHENQLANKGLMVVSLETFKKENQIGEGPSAIIYIAESADGELIAVKCRKDATSETRLEEEILLRISSQPNIVSLVGYVQDGPDRRHLVFEYVCRGNLSMNLRLGGESLDWLKRLDIALQVCSAIQKLHMHTKPPVYHGNIASENILLDECSNAKLCGFKSANYCSNSRTNPENLSEMFEDIWGFGIVLVELLTGEHIEDKDSCNFENFDEINDFVGGRERLDRRLDTPRDQWRIMALSKLGDIAKWCIACSRSVGGSKCNPKIGDLLSSLNQVKEMFCCA